MQCTFERIRQRQCLPNCLLFDGFNVSQPSYASLCRRVTHGGNWSIDFRRRLHLKG